jgi:predicted TIM-barrel fold metal-dependent hydrolase
MDNKQGVKDRKQALRQDVVVIVEEAEDKNDVHRLAEVVQHLIGEEAGLAFVLGTVNEEVETELSASKNQTLSDEEDAEGLDQTVREHG